MKRLAFCLLIASLVLCSCSTAKRGEASPPSWVLINPTETDDCLYGVGGPCRTIQQSELEAKAEISAVVNTVVASSSQSSTSIEASIVNDDASRVNETVFRSEMSSKSNASFSLGKVVEKWQDPATGMWWVLYEVKKTAIGK